MSISSDFLLPYLALFIYDLLAELHKCQFFISLSSNAFDLDEPLQITGNTLQILKLQSFTELTVKICDPRLYRR